MGLLDFLGSTGDPERDAARNRGLLAAGLQLMQAKGRLFPALGQAGMTGLGAADQFTMQQQAAQARKLQQQMAQMQLSGAQRDEQIANLPRLLTSPGGSQAFDATGGMDTAVENQNNVARPQGLDLKEYFARLQGIDPVRAAQVAAILQPPKPKPIVSKPGDVARDEAGNVLWQNPAAPDASKDVQNYEYAKAEGYKGTFEQWRKDGRQPAAVININPEKALAQGLGGIAAKNIEASQNAAEAAQATLGLVGGIRSAVKEGEVLLGPGAAIRQSGLRIGQLIGAGSTGSAETLARTKQVEQGLAGLELEAAQLLKGQGQVTEAERGIIRKAAAGQIQDLTTRELEVALNAIERNAKRKIDIHAQRMRQMPQGAAGAVAPLLNVPDATPTERVRRYNPVTKRIE